MKSITNIHFHKSGKTRFVKHGFSWQLFFFGPIAFIMRGQWPLALGAAVFLYVTSFITGALAILVFDMPDDFVVLPSVAVACGLVGHFGNRISARSYVKNGWLPVNAFPHDWNTPPLLPAQSLDGATQ